MTYCYMVILLIIYVLVSRTCYLVYLQKHSIFAKGTWNWRYFYIERQNLLNSSHLKWNIKIIKICNNLHKLINFFFYFVICVLDIHVVWIKITIILSTMAEQLQKLSVSTVLFFNVVDLWKSCRHCHLIHIVHSHMPKKMMQSDIYYVKQPSSQLLPDKFQLSKFSPL